MLQTYVDALITNRVLYPQDSEGIENSTWGNHGNYYKATWKLGISTCTHSGVM